MKVEYKVHHETVVVNDKFLTAALTARGHESHGVYQYEDTGSFYCLFKPTKQLRDDIKLYYKAGLLVDVKEVSEHVVYLNDALSDYRAYVEEEMLREMKEALN
jgi:hypothetical protein